MATEDSSSSSQQAVQQSPQPGQPEAASPVAQDPAGATPSVPSVPKIESAITLTDQQKRSSIPSTSAPAPLTSSSSNSNNNNNSCSNLSVAPPNAAPNRNAASAQAASTMGLLDEGRYQHIGARKKTFLKLDELFNENDVRIKEEILQMILQYLQDEGYNASRLTLQDESSVKMVEQKEQNVDSKRMRKAIMDGDWAEVEKLCQRPRFKNQKSFLYAVYKQQFLEHIEKHEIQKAFTYLTKRLKPLESTQTTPGEFKDLCYLLAAKSIHDVPSFRNWEGIGPAREKLVEQFQNMLDSDILETAVPEELPNGRLLQLIRQAVAYQIEFSRYHPKMVPRVNSILHDYTSFIIPNAVKHTFVGHEGNVKCVDFVGEEGEYIISGSSDNTMIIWETETGRQVSKLEGHTSRIWDVTTSRSGSRVASASGDGTVKIWNLHHPKYPCVQTLQVSQKDIYTAKYHPSESTVVTGGYDKLIRLYDVETGSVAKVFSGHQLSVSRVIFNPLGNLIVSGSKDNTIKFWDVISGVCIKTISTHLGEVTSVEINQNGTMLLSSSKDNSNRLWDIRMLRPIRKFKGHQNTSKNFVRSSFARNSLIIGGSEDGVVHLWDADRGCVLQKLRGHADIVYNCIWNSRQSLFVSCSEDLTLKTWWYDESKPLLDEYF